MGVGAPVLAQTPTLEERGVAAETRAPQNAINDHAFDCAALKDVIGAAGQKFAPLRGAALSSQADMNCFAAAKNLFGDCAILDKEKVGEASYSCESNDLSIADIKATIETCLGNEAGRYAGNENPNTPFLRYEPTIAGGGARILALTTFGKKTLSVISKSRSN